MSMPITWVEKIFKKLLLTYGRDFTGRYEGVDLMDLKTDWAHELGGFEQRPEAIRHALQNLPMAKPPTVYEFRAICASAPQMQAKALPAPPQDPAIVAAIVSSIKSKPTHNGMKDWAYRLKARHDAGDPLSLNQIKCYQDALGAAA